MKVPTQKKPPPTTTTPLLFDLLLKPLVSSLSPPPSLPETIKMHSILLFLLLLLLLLLLFSSAVMPSSSADDNTAFVYAGCSQSRYAGGTPYELNVDAVLTSLANAAATSPYAKFTSSAASSSFPANGLLQCSGDLPASLCDSCVHSAITQLSSFCPSAAAAAVQLRGCLVRYGNDSFLGKPDTSLMYKKCGADAGADAGVYNSAALGMRDAALAALSSRSAARTAGGYYRAGADGYVQAVAQCVGDQSGKQCDECIAAAVAQLRAGCAVSVAGDVYLGKCYVRSWSSGAYGIGSTSGYPGIGTGTVFGINHDHDHDSGKTLAIIIGLMAGVALLIIFFTFIRRVGYPGKH